MSDLVNNPEDEGNGSGMPYAELDQYASNLEMELDIAKGKAALLQSKIDEFSTLGWNEARAVKLRRLETFYARFVNIMDGSSTHAPVEVMIRLKDLASSELKHLPENPWNDISPSKESKTRSL